MYRVRWTNFGYDSPEKFGTAAEALAYGKSKCFEFLICRAEDMIASWGPIRGLHVYAPEYGALYHV